MWSSFFRLYAHAFGAGKRLWTPWANPQCGDSAIAPELLDRLVEWDFEPNERRAITAVASLIQNFPYEDSIVTTRSRIAEISVLDSMSVQIALDCLQLDKVIFVAKAPGDQVEIRINTEYSAWMR